MGDKIFIKELTASTTHYLQGHPHCGCIHGHTYFVTDVEVECKGFVDFGDLKAQIKSHLDHMFVVPLKHAQFWRKVIRLANETGIELHDNIMPMDIECTTVENMSKWLAEYLKLVIPSIKKISFKLSEGPNQGAII